MNDFEYIYNDFFEKNRKYINCKNQETKVIFDEIYKAENIAKMIIEIDHGTPAIVGVLDLVEKHFGENKISDQFKKTFGAYVAYILQPFGYIKTHQKKLGKMKSQFSSGSCYIKAGVVSKRLVVKYEIYEC